MNVEYATLVIAVCSLIASIYAGNRANKAARETIKSSEEIAKWNVKGKYEFEQQMDSLGRVFSH